MAILAARNLRRGLALGLPSGQGAAHALGLTPADVSLQFADLTSSLWQLPYPWPKPHQGSSAMHALSYLASESARERATRVQALPGP